MATEPFEQKFGILADSTLNAKLPEMKTFAIGFQVVDTEDENSRAFGVQLYNIGKHLVMVPMFWLKGKVKGGEVMYVKDLNRFLPFTEVDVNNLKTGKTFSMGDPEPEGDKKSKGDAYSVSTMELNWLNTKRAGEVTLIDKRDIAQMLAHTGEYKMPELKDIRMFGPQGRRRFHADHEGPPGVHEYPHAFPHAGGDSGRRDARAAQRRPYREDGLDKAEDRPLLCGRSLLQGG